MKKILLILPALVFLFSLATVPSRALAAFDAGSVFPDAVLTSKDTMNESQIQAFLVAKGSFLANYVMPANKQVPYPCDLDGDGNKESTCQSWINTIGWNNDVDVSGWSAAKVIYSAAQWYGVNPQLIITTLQKEQSSITTGTQGWAGQTDWAMGYGVPDGSGADYHYFGFAKQIDMATWQFRWVFEGSGGNVNWYPPLPYGGSMWDVGKTVSCPVGVWETWSGANVGPCINTQINSRVASALYKHNPYRANKEGLYSIYYNWFEIVDTVKNNLTLSNFYINNTNVFVGENISGQFSLTNTSDNDIVLDSVGLAARPGSVTSSTNRDFGWDTNVTIASGQTKNFYYETVIKDVGKTYVWPAFSVGGAYGGYYIGWTELNGRYPNVTIKQQIYTDPTNFIAGQTAAISAIFVNNENKDIYYSDLGIPVRFYDKWNYDAGWVGNGYIPANSEKMVVGSILFDKAGPYTSWGSINIFSTYIGVKNPAGVQYYSYNVKPMSPNFGASEFWISDTHPTVGETIKGSFKITNYLPVPVTLDAVGLVARPGNVGSALNRDFGWYANESFTPWQSKTYNFTYTVKDVGITYVWPAINYQGSYFYFWPGWTEITSSK